VDSQGRLQRRLHRASGRVARGPPQYFPANSADLPTIRFGIELVEPFKPFHPENRED
jgi:hypothetical protein